MSHIVAGIGTVGGCYACYQSAGWLAQACGLCLNSLVGAGLISCDIGQDCHTDYVCLNDPALEEERC